MHRCYHLHIINQSCNLQQLLNQKIPYRKIKQCLHVPLIPHGFICQDKCGNQYRQHAEASKQHKRCPGNVTGKKLCDTCLQYSPDSCYHCQKTKIAHSGCDHTLMPHNKSHNQNCNTKDHCNQTKKQKYNSCINRRQFPRILIHLRYNLNTQLLPLIEGRHPDQTPVGALQHGKWQASVRILPDPFLIQINTDMGLLTVKQDSISQNRILIQLSADNNRISCFSCYFTR